MADPAAAARSGARLTELAREFWQGVTRPGFTAACAALALAAGAWLAVIAGSTSGHVRRTPAEQWLRNPIDDYALLTARSIQGAVVHAPAGTETIVFVGPSIMREALPDERTLTAIFSENRPTPVRALKLCGSSLGILEVAAVIDKFGANFRGVFVIASNRHVLNRGVPLDGVTREGTDGALGFASPVWEEELRRAGVTPPHRSGWEFWDDREFYIRTMGGWRYAWGRKPELFPHFFTSGKPPSPERVRALLPVEDPRARDGYLAAVARIAGRLRNAGGARLVVMEFSRADGAMPELQDAAWHAAEQRHAVEMQAWSNAHGVPWIDVRAALDLRAADFCDAVHIINPQARERFARAIAVPLRGLQP